MIRFVRVREDGDGINIVNRSQHETPRVVVTCPYFSYGEGMHNTPRLPYKTCQGWKSSITQTDYQIEESRNILYEETGFEVWDVTCMLVHPLQGIIVRMFHFFTVAGSQ